VSAAPSVDSDKLTFSGVALADPDQLMTAAEVAILLRVSQRWVEDAGRDGRLPSVPLGRNRRYRRATIVSYLSRLES
jgi:excisionase family DNA binding protein